MNNVQQCMSDDGNTHLTQKKHGKPHVKKIEKKIENWENWTKRGATHPFTVGFPSSHLRTPALMLLRPCGKIGRVALVIHQEKTKKNDGKKKKKTNKTI